jgi:hypothetical protein
LAFPLSLFLVWLRCHACCLKFYRLRLLSGNVPEASDQWKRAV